MNEEKLLSDCSTSNRGVYQLKQIQKQQKNDHAQETSAQILGYDAITGQFKVKDKPGRIFYARAITNSGELSIGSQVSLVFPIGSIPVIDAMPK